jgi:hypothetical protein
MHTMFKALSFLAVAGLSQVAQAATYYVAPTGSDSNAGTLAAPWKSIAKAQSVAVGGDTVYFRGGTYQYTAGLNSCASTTDTVNAITLNKSGSSGSPIRYWAYSTEVPVFDFGSMTDNCRVKGFNITASYVHLRGLEVRGVPQHAGNYDNNESWGIWINGSNNTFERLDTHHHMGPGLFILNGANNLVLNVDSHDNYDPYSKAGDGQNADGFGVHIGANMPGNVFRGCRSWANSDDGFDTINAASVVTIENSWTWRNGYIPGTTTPAPSGNGNGFKVGGFGGGYVANAPVHVVRFNLAFNNKAHGFYANHHPVASKFYDNTSVNNHVGFDMTGVDSTGSTVARGILRNNLSYQDASIVANVAGADVAYNSWNLQVTVTSADFQSDSTNGLTAPRQANGDLPVLPNFRLASGSDLIDKGTNVGLAYNGTAPDLGAFER